MSEDFFRVGTHKKGPPPPPKKRRATKKNRQDFPDWTNKNVSNTCKENLLSVADLLFPVLRLCSGDA